MESIPTQPMQQPAEASQAVPTPSYPFLQKLRSPWAAIVGIIAIFLVGSLIFNSTQVTKPAMMTSTPTPTIILTPTPQRTPSAIASQSAFQTLDASVQSLANDLNTLTIQNSSLSPPVLDLVLGL